MKRPCRSGSGASVAFVLALLLVVVALTVAACGGSSTTAAETSAPSLSAAATSSSTPTPADTGSPEAVPATQTSITVGSFTFRVLRVVSDKAIFGMVPKGMGSADQIVYVEFRLPRGQHKAFAGLKPTVTTPGSGTVAEPAAWVSGNRNYTLTDMTLEGTESTFSLTKGAVALAYVVPKDLGQLLLGFSSGETVDLTPVMP